MLEKFIEFVTKFKTTIFAIAGIVLIVILSLVGYKVYRWIYPKNQETIETINPADLTKVETNKKDTQILPEAKHLDETIEDILKSL